MVDSVREVPDELESAVKQARDWLLELSDETVRFRPAPDRWTIAEVIGHLVDSATNNHQRFIRAQEVDSFTFPKYEQVSWVKLNDYGKSDWSTLVELWCLYNLHLAHVIRNIPADQWETECVIEPYPACTLGFLITDYLDHLNHHLVKIRERIA